MRDRGHIVSSTLVLGLATYLARDYVLAHTAEWVVFSAGYAVATLFLSPDLDTSSQPLNRWGPLSIIWAPYEALFRHRGNSHNMLTGLLVRLVYLGVVILALGWLLQFRGIEIPITAEQLIAFVTTNRQALLLLGAGAWSGSLMHIVEDIYIPRAVGKFLG